MARLRSSVLDGEAVYCDGDGVANFEKLHSQAHNDRGFLYAFDLLGLGGVDLRPQPLEERRGRLQLLRKVTGAGVQFNEHIVGDGATIFEQACKPDSRASSPNTGIIPTDQGRARPGSKFKNPRARGVLRFEDKT